MSAVGYADLHIHTTASDSSYSPAEVVARAVRNHVTLMAVCDHNVIAGSLAAEPLARDAGISFIRGVEIDAPAATCICSPIIPTLSTGRSAS